MKSFKKALIFIFLLVSCGDENHHHPENSNSPQQTQTNDDAQDNGQRDPIPETKLDYSLLSPSPVKVDGKNFITRGAIPNSSDKRYMKVYFDRNKKIKFHNHQTISNGTKEVFISGKMLIIDSDDHQGILEHIAKSTNISKVVFYCESLTLDFALKIPGAEVEINAENFHITEKGRLDLTPSSAPTRANQFEDGLEGQHAKSLTLNISNITYPNQLESPIIILKGGNGQEAGQGQDGAKGTSLRNLGGGVVYRETRTERCVRERDFDHRFRLTNEHKIWDCHTTGPSREGSASWPGHGQNAIAGGNPGEPGNGGRVFSNIKLPDSLYDLSGGLAGKKAPNYTGGAPGTPTTAYHQSVFNGHHSRSTRINTATHHTKKGKDAKSPAAKIQVGQIGYFKVQRKKPWQSDGYFEFQFKYAKDLYRINRLDESKTVLKTLLDNCKTIEKAPEKFFYALDYCNKSQSQKYQLTSQLDYYGNSATWVPNLSFEANYQLYNTEIDRSFRILYLTYWLLKKHDKVEQQIKAINKTQDKLFEQIEEDGKNFNKLSQSIPSLKTKLEDVKIDETYFQKELKRVEQEILAAAQRNVEQRHKVPFYKTAVKKLAAISTVIPAGQPALGAIGNTVNAVVQGMGTDKPWDQLIDTLPNTIGSFMPSKLEASRDNWNRTREKIDYSNYRKIFALTPENSPYTAEEIKQKKNQYFEDLKGFATPIAKELAKLARENEMSQVPRSEIQKEITEIKNSHPLFKQITQKLEALLAKRESLAAEILQLNTLMAKITDEITSSYFSIAKLSEAKSKLAPGIDHGLQELLFQIEEKTKERLDKYNYLLIKAYQYRMLKKFPGKLDLVPVMEKIQNLVNTTNSIDELSDQEFDSIKSMYENQLSQVVESIVEEINGGTHFHSQAIRTFNLSKLQIKALNEGYNIYLDLKHENIFGDQEDLEDVRINEVMVDDLQFEIDGEPEVIAEGTLTLNYTGKSYIKKNNDHFLFEFGTNSSKSRLTWGGKKNILHDVMTPIKPSYADNSLLSSLLSQNEDNILLFARAGGLTELKLKLKTKVDKDVEVKLKSATISIDYDYLNQ